jgi:aldehyde dehydrogenase (NAD+)
VETIKHLIDGEWVASHSGATFESRNPANSDDLVGVFQRGDARDVDDAVRAAKAAYPGWLETPAPKRADYVYRVGILLEQRKEELAQLMAREMG